MFDFLRQVYKGKTIGRILQNRALSEHFERLSGVVIDIAGTENASYRRYMPDEARVTSLNTKGAGATVVADFNETLPLDDESADAVLLINALYIAEDPLVPLREAYRILKPGGTFILGNPFIENEMPEPHDYERLTAEGLTRALTVAGFHNISIERHGDRFAAAVHLLHPAFLFNTVRLVAFLSALILDRLIPGNVKKEHPAPIGYLVAARK